MNENIVIGAKGSSSDRRRCLKITKKQKEKLEESKRLSKEELKKLEKKVRKQQILNLISIVPLFIIGNIFNTTKPKNIEKDESLTQENNNELIKENKNVENIQNNIKTKNQLILTKEVTKVEKLQFKNQEKIKEELLEKELTNIKSRKIVEEYQNKIKEIRYNLRNYYFESDILDQVDDLENNPSLENLEKLNELIYKLEELKEKIAKETKLEIDDNYLSVLIEEDLEKIRGNIAENNMENSEIYSAIKDKIDELKVVEVKVEEKVENKKQEKNIEEEKLNLMKEKYQKTKEFTDEIVQFKTEQENIVKSIQNKMSSEINKIDNRRIQLNGMQKQSSLLVKRLKKYMATPGVRGGKKIVTMTALYLYYFAMMVSKTPTKKRSLNISVKDYTKEIETNINEIDKVLKEIKKTSHQIDKTINNFKKEYQEYALYREFQEIIENLERMKKNLEEKEYEIARLKKEQEKNLTKNNEYTKVYTH